MSNSFSFSLLLFSFLIFFASASDHHLAKGSCSDFESEPSMATLGGLRESQGTPNDAEIQGLARFAVEEHNKKENALLEFARVVKAKEQVVAGTLHHLTIEAIDTGKKKLYEAKVWVKPWMNFKELQEFKHTEDSPSFTASDLGANRGNDEISCKGMLQDGKKCQSMTRKFKMLRTMHFKPYSKDPTLCFRMNCNKSHMPRLRLWTTLRSLTFTSRSKEEAKRRCSVWRFTRTTRATSTLIGWVPLIPSSRKIGLCSESLYFASSKLPLT